MYRKIWVVVGICIFPLVCFSQGVSNTATLGGIGTGKIDILENGKFAHITTNHNPHHPLNDFNGCFAAIAIGEGTQATLQKLYRDADDSSTIANVHVQADFPYAYVGYADPTLPVQVNLEAMSPVWPGAIGESCYPAILFRYTVHNPTSQTLKVSLAMSWRNLVGLGSAGKEIGDSTGIFHHTLYKKSNRTGIKFQLQTDAPSIRHSNTFGTYLLAYQSISNEKVSILPAWQPETDPTALEMFLKNPNQANTPPVAQRPFDSSTLYHPAAAVAAQQGIPAHESRVFTFFLAWYMPHQWSSDGLDHGVYYTTRWNSVEKVVDALSKRHKTLDENIRKWKFRYTQSSLPAWFSKRLLNAMSVLAQDGVFLKNGQFALLTRNPHYPGNLGSPEERLVDMFFLLQCFPGFLRSEIEWMADCQLADGEVPSAVGNLEGLIGNGNVPGGFIGRPDSTAAFVLLVYQDYLWTGDRSFLDKMYPHTRFALRWLMYHDSNDDRIPDGPSVWPWSRENVTSLFTGNLAMAAFRVGEELEQIYQDLEFQSWCRRYIDLITNHLGRQLWNGYHYNAFFDPTRPTTKESAVIIPGLFGGEWYPTLNGMNPLLPVHRRNRSIQALAHDTRQQGTSKQTTDPDSIPAWRYGFASAFAAPLLIRQGYAEEAFQFLQYQPGTKTDHFTPKETGLWATYASLAGIGMDMNRRCLIVGPSLPEANRQFTLPFSSPLYAGTLRYARSPLSGQQQCVIQLDRVPRYSKDTALQQVAFMLPAQLDANDMQMLVYHNDQMLAGQDFSRESLRVFGVQQALKLKKGDTITLLVAPKEGPHLSVNVQNRDIQNYGAKCRIDKTGLALPGVSFYITNLIQEKQLLSIEFTHPLAGQDYAVFINGEERPFPVPSPESIPLVLPRSPVAFEEAYVLRITGKACQDAAVKLASTPGSENLKKNLWQLQEEVNRLIEIDASQRGVRIDVLPKNLADQLQFPELQLKKETLQQDIDKLNEMRQTFMSDMQTRSGDPILASELTGYFVPVEWPVSIERIPSATQSYRAEIRLLNRLQSPIKSRITVNIPNGWKAQTSDAVEFDDRERAEQEHVVHYTIEAAGDLWQKRQSFDVVLSGTWRGYPFRKQKAVYLGHDFVKRWMILGPFPNERGEGFAKIHPPEHNIQLQETYPGIKGQIAWKEHAFPRGYIDLDAIMTPNDNAVAYAYTSIYSPREQPVQFHIGCNGDLKLFLNYQPIYEKRNIGKPRPGGVVVPHRLYQGWNHLVVKLSELTGPWGFYFEVYDIHDHPINGIQFALDKVE